MKRMQTMKRSKHFTTLVCLLVGMLVLTSAVYANYDSANGYSSYKNALKYLAFEADNVTADVELRMDIDGEEYAAAGVMYQIDGEKSANYNWDWTSGDERWERWYYDDGKTRTSY